MPVFFGYLTPEVEQVRYNNMYHPRSVEEKSPALARVLRTVSEGLFGDGGIYEPYVFVPIPHVTLPNLRPLADSSTLSARATTTSSPTTSTPVWR